LGFTLVELLAVMVIVLILAMISFKIAGYVRRKAKYTKVESDLNELQMAASKYKEYKGSYYNLFSAGTSEASQNSGLPTRDPWGNSYQMTHIDRKDLDIYPNWNRNSFSLGSDTNRYLEIDCMYYVAFSFGPDRAPGVRTVDDEKGLKNSVGEVYGDNVKDRYSKGYNQPLTLREIGFGDDIVRGDCPIRKMFPEYSDADSHNGGYP
jgi:prepilin-type N-terminal cleavage/methylation domain-containing protein